MTVIARTEFYLSQRGGIFKVILYHIAEKFGFQLEVILNGISFHLHSCQLFKLQIRYQNKSVRKLTHHVIVGIHYVLK